MRMTLVCISKIQEVLNREGLTPAAASRRIGASSDYLGDIMRAGYNGFARISKNRLNKFCDEFNVSYSYMTTRGYARKHPTKEDAVPGQQSLPLEKMEEQATSAPKDNAADELADILQDVEIYLKKQEEYYGLRAQRAHDLRISLLKDKKEEKKEEPDDQ